MLLTISKKFLPKTLYNPTISWMICKWKVHLSNCKRSCEILWRNSCYENKMKIAEIWQLCHFWVKWIFVKWRYKQKNFSFRFSYRQGQNLKSPNGNGFYLHYQLFGKNPQNMPFICLNFGHCVAHKM